MASLVNERGRWRVDVIVGSRRAKIRLGRIGERERRRVKERIEALATAKLLGQVPDGETARWLASVQGKLRERLEAAGLAEGRAEHRRTLSELLREFLAHVGVKAGTLRTYRQTERSLIEAFGADWLISQIGTLDADRWRSTLLASGLAAATVSKRVKTARQAFKLAVRWKWITENPFADVRAGAQVNRSRMRFVSVQETQKVLEACPDPEWRLIVALARFGGLRCSSEVLRLKWEDVQWDADRLVVHASKTEHHGHGGVRLVPIFPELRPLLLEVFERAQPGAVHVITRYRDGANLNPQLRRIVERAGLVPWPRLFNNLRSSR